MNVVLLFVWVPHKDNRYQLYGHDFGQGSRDLIEKERKKRKTSHQIEQPDLEEQLDCQVHPISQIVSKYLMMLFPELALETLQLPSNQRKYGCFHLFILHGRAISKPHKNMADYRGGFTAVVPMGDYQGYHMNYPELNISVELKPGSVLFFDPIEPHQVLTGSGERRSIVFICRNRTINQYCRDIVDQKMVPLSRVRRSGLNE